jgi:transposase
MERLEAKKVNGQTYYYYSVWGWVNGKCRRKFQKYLGKPADIFKAMHAPPSFEHAEVFAYGLPIALWIELGRQRIVETVNQLCPKRSQGLSVGDYLGIAAVNRATEPTSKKGMWEWFHQSSLHRVWPEATRELLSSQRYWDHMDAVSIDSANEIWARVITDCLKRESITVDEICYDGTNFYTFIDTFNTASSLAQRGKNKQGRSNLRQVSYALFCTAGEQIPLCFDVYPGNRNDCPEFAAMISRFRGFLTRIGWEVGPEFSLPVTLIFDKGNNSAANIARMDRDNLHFIGSVKLGEHSDLAAISNRDERFAECRDPQLPGIRSFRLNKTIYGKPRTVIICYNPRLHEQQLMTLNADIAKAVDGLCLIRAKLEDRGNGLLRGGKTPTLNSVKSQVDKLLQRQFLRDIIAIRITQTPYLRMDFEIDTEKLDHISDTWLGKKIIITTRFDWEQERIIKAYHDQYAIEHVFRNMKDRRTGVWWPMHHWTDQKIHIHALYCTIATLLRALILRRVRKAQMHIAYQRVFSELAKVKEIIGSLKSSRRTKKNATVTALSKRNEIQDRLFKALSIPLSPQNLGPDWKTDDLG